MSKITIKELSQWEWTDKVGNKHIAPKYRVCGKLIKELFPQNFWTKKALNEEQGTLLAYELEKCGFITSPMGAKMYATTFLIKNYGAWKEPAYKICRKELENLYLQLTNN